MPRSGPFPPPQLLGVLPQVPGWDSFVRVHFLHEAAQSTFDVREELVVEERVSMRGKCEAEKRTENGKAEGLMERDMTKMMYVREI
jgi:hypothetical protein